ncbi:MAG: hypothetical protein AOA65_0945 [Candidatus Bathyarchaeota archaeon BA1]|nr:MAG: hypothetical protein AOA65_0945 [Candidatus Bathyarchaeota archaeon BA1]
MTYWLCRIDEDNFMIVKRRWIWGLQEEMKEVMKQVKLGDYLIFLSPDKIGGVFIVTSNPFVSKIGIFKGGVFPYRVEVKPTDFVPKEPIEFRLFYKEKEAPSIKRISKADFDLIRSEIGKHIKARAQF